MVAPVKIERQHPLAIVNSSNKPMYNNEIMYFIKQHEISVFAKHINHNTSLKSIMQKNNETAFRYISYLLFFNLKEYRMIYLVKQRLIVSIKMICNVLFESGMEKTKKRKR